MIVITEFDCYITASTLVSSDNYLNGRLFSFKIKRLPKLQIAKTCIGPPIGALN